MTHAWLFTGPPGSGRSVAARAFAAALQCERRRRRLRRVRRLPHRRARAPTPTSTSSSPRACRSRCRRCASIVLTAARLPSLGRWQVVLVEDADRLTEAASNALLKAVEEPPQRTVFLLCAPSTHPDDVAITIRSRCRRRPAAHAVAGRGRRRAGATRRHRPGAGRMGGAGVAGPRRPGPAAGPGRRGARPPDGRAVRAGVADHASAPASRPPTSWSPRPSRRRRRCRPSSTARRPRRSSRRSAPAAPARARRRPPAAPPARSRSWSAGSGPGPPGRSGTRWTARWSTWPRSTATCCWPSAGADVRAAHPDVAADVRVLAARLTPEGALRRTGRRARLPRGDRAQRQAAHRGGGDDGGAAPAPDIAPDPAHVQSPHGHGLRGELRAVRPALLLRPGSVLARRSATRCWYPTDDGPEVAECVWAPQWVSEDIDGHAGAGRHGRRRRTWIATR